MQTSGILRTSTGAGMNLGKWLWKNRYIVIIVFSLIPILLTSIQISKETNNPSYIPVSIGLSVINADGVLFENVHLLKTEPETIIGMEKPTEGIFKKIKYYFKLARLSWTILALISMITLPFLFFRYIWNQTNNSTKTRSLILALITFIIFIFVVNLIRVTIGISDGSEIYHLDKSQNFFLQGWTIIKYSLPLHGLVSLFKFLFQMAI